MQEWPRHVLQVDVQLQNSLLRNCIVRPETVAARLNAGPASPLAIGTRQAHLRGRLVDIVKAIISFAVRHLYDERRASHPSAGPHLPHVGQVQAQAISVEYQNN